MSRRRDRWQDVEVEPQTGRLGMTGQRVERSAPVITPLGMSRQRRAFVLRCEVSGCAWDTGEASSPSACLSRLAAHVIERHDAKTIESTAVRIRSGKSGAFRFDVIEL